MENWNENNLSSVLEYPFDFDRYIEERIREIDDLDERRFAKKVLLEGLGKVIKKIEHRYDNLQQRVLQEIDIPENHYNICTTIVKKEHYDPTNNTLFPLCMQDLSEKEIKKYFREEGKTYIETVYLENNLSICNDFLTKNTFRGWIGNELEKKEMTFYVKKATRYYNEIERLYHTFLDNQIPWKTVNIMYIDHFFDVYICSDKDTDELLTSQISIDFEIFADDIKRDFIPLWNVEHINFSSADFRMPCINEIYYEHEFLIEETKAEDGYLIQFNEDILGVRHDIDSENKKIVIKSTKEKYKNWVALCIRQERTIVSLDYNYPVIGNDKKDSFIRRYAKSTQVNLLTKADLFRKIMELDIKDYIRIEDCEILNNEKDYPQAESMNWFMRDDVFSIETRKILLLKFKELQAGNYMNDSMIKYVVSHMQMQLNEYRCVGIIIE